MICKYCGLDKDDVELLYDPYLVEIENYSKEEAACYICSECFEERVMEI